MVGQTLRKVPAPLYMFFVWTVVVTALTSGFTKQAIQNLLCYLIFVGAMTVVSLESSSETGPWLLRWLIRVAFLRALIEAFYLIAFGTISQQDVGARAFGITGLICLAVTVPLPNGGTAVHCLNYVLFAEILLSGSRSATVIAALLLTFTSVRTARGVSAIGRALFKGSLAAFVVYYAVVHLPALHDRFFAGDKGGAAFGTTFNTSGRAVLWRVVYDDSKGHVLFGQGAGTSSALVRQVVQSSGEPHNDYLRLFHDFGIVGVSLWMVGYLILLHRIYQRARSARNVERGLHFAAAIALIGIALIAVTDNALIYYFTMLPLAVLVGTSLSYPARARAVTNHA